MSQSVTTPALPLSASTHSYLREATRADHEAVDAAFAGFRLDDPESYGRFLSAHARVLPGAETATAPTSLIPGWNGRTEALLRDLDALGRPHPSPVDAPAPAGQAQRWGALYVIEGSRLGGALLSRQVGEDLPRAYLSSVHGAGDWRAFLSLMDDADSGDAWRAGALQGARTMFSAYKRAVEIELSHG